MYVEKAAETTFVRKTWAYNVDEIEPKLPWKRRLFQTSNCPNASIWTFFADFSKALMIPSSKSPLAKISWNFARTEINEKIQFYF